MNKKKLTIYKILSELFNFNQKSTYQRGSMIYKHNFDPDTQNMQVYEGKLSILRKGEFKIIIILLSHVQRGNVLLLKQGDTIKTMF